MIRQPMIFFPLILVYMVNNFQFLIYLGKDNKNKSEIM